MSSTSAGAWSNGSPPEIVKLWYSVRFSQRATSTVVARTPSAGAHVSGEVHRAQPMPHPWTQSTTAGGGPSFTTPVATLFKRRSFMSTLTKGATER
jgi:hypothetical protein